MRKSLQPVVTKRHTRSCTVRADPPASQRQTMQISTQMAAEKPTTPGCFRHGYHGERRSVGRAVVAVRALDCHLIAEAQPPEFPGPKLHVTLQRVAVRDSRTDPFVHSFELTLEIPPGTFLHDRPKSVMPLTCFVADFILREVDKDQHWMWVARVLRRPRGE